MDEGWGETGETRKETSLGVARITEGELGVEEVRLSLSSSESPNNVTEEAAATAAVANLS